jgi:tetratricopeptide (TPR) repeat protein
MGGYAAMVTAAKLNAGKALVFSPQTIIDHRLPNQPSSDIDVRYPNAFDTLSQSPETKIKFLVGTEDLADIFNVAQALQYRRFDVEFIYRAPHNLMNFMFQRDMLLEIVSSHLENRPSRILFPVLNLLDHPNLVEICCDFVRGLYFNETDSATINSKLNQLQNASPDWPAVYHHRGKLLAKNNKHVDAIGQFEKAVSFNTCDDSIFFSLGKSAIQAKEYEKAEYAFRKANEISLKPSPTYLSNLGAAMMLQGRYEDSICTQKQVLELSSEFGPAHYQLGLVFNITKRYAEAVPMFKTAIKIGHKNPNLDKHLETAKNMLQGNTLQS